MGICVFRSWTWACLVAMMSWTMMTDELAGHSLGFKHGGDLEIVCGPIDSEASLRPPWLTPGQISNRSL